jgi:hypothetical protein
MPLFRTMSDADKFSVLSSLDVKLTGIMETRVKLRERRRAENLTDEEDFEIETLLLRLDRHALAIVNYKNALLTCQDELQPPTAEQLDDMRRRVGIIRDINVQNATASAIITTTAVVIGELPKELPKTG